MEIEPIKPAAATRRARLVKRMKLRDEDKQAEQALVPAEAADDQPQRARNPYTPQLASFSVQLLSGSEPRGLKAGEIVRKSAKAAYLNTEYSGPAKRRAEPGEQGGRDI